MAKSVIVLAGTALALAQSMAAQAEVVSSAPDRFLIQIDRPLVVRPVSPAEGAHTSSPATDPAATQLWQRLLTPGQWWSDAHSWGGDAATMRIEPRVGGCWCETLSGGGEVEHGRIIAILPGERLLMRAELGPLQSSAVTGKLEWRFVTTAAGRVLRLRYDVQGALPMAATPLAAAVDAVLTEQMDRLLAMLDQPHAAP